MAAAPSSRVPIRSAGTIQSSRGDEPASFSPQEESLSMWEIRKKRMETLCCSNRPSGTLFREAWRRQQLASEKGAIIVLLLVVCESLASFASTKFIFGSFLDAWYQEQRPEGYFQTYGSAVLRTHGFPYVALILFPIAGWLGDAKVGRYKMVVANLMIQFATFTIAAFYFSFYQLLPQIGGPYKMFITIVFYVLICAGAAGVSANIIPFGADQLLYGPAEQVTSYFNWYTWTREVGRLLIAISFWIHAAEVRAFVATFAASVVAAVAVVVSTRFKQWLFVENERRNPLKDIFDVLRFAVAAKRPELVSAFGYDGRNAPSRVDLAKSKHGGRFDSHTVEDVKTFLSLLPLLVTLGIALSFVLGIQSSLVLQANNMYIDKPGAVNHVWLELLNAMLNSVIILLAIPIMDQLIFPFLRDFTPSTLKRIGMGWVSLVLASFISMLHEAVSYHQSRSNDRCVFSLNDGVGADSPSLPFWLYLLTQTLLSVSYMLIKTSSFEFFYTQSPHRMRGMMIGLLLFSEGLLGGVFTALQTAFIANGSSSPDQPCRIWYYLITLVTAVIAFVIFISVTLKYKRRMRAGIEDSGRYYLITPRRS